MIAVQSILKRITSFLKKNLPPKSNQDSISDNNNNPFFVGSLPLKDNKLADNPLYQASSDIEGIESKIKDSKPLDAGDIKLLISNENSDYPDIDLSEIYQQVLDNRKTVKMDSDAQRVFDRHTQHKI